MAKIKQGKQVFAEINITPLTDVCLVLLIIFMVTATFLTQSSGLDVALPKAASAQELPAKQIELTVMKDGSVFLDGQGVATPQLRDTLSARLRQTSLKTVVIKADADVPYKHVVDVMDAARVQGADITLAADLQQAVQQQR
jgi:biopolymer transport protein ExbD